MLRLLRFDVKHVIGRGVSAASAGLNSCGGWLDTDCDMHLRSEMEVIVE